MTMPYAKGPPDWSREGRFLLYWEGDPNTGFNQKALEMTRNENQSSW